MELQNPVSLQIAIDLALLVAIIFLLWRVNANIKQPPININKEMIAELKAVIAESQATADIFVKTLEQSRITLKEIALELDLKEKRVKTILEKSVQKIEKPQNNTVMDKEGNIPQGKYDEVINLIRKGYSGEATAQKTGFTEPEIALIIDLYRIKNENS